MNWIIGADGLIGGALGDHYRRQQIPFLATSRRAAVSSSSIKLDLAADPKKWKIPGETPDVVFFCAAQTNIKACDEDPRGTARVNVDATVELSRSLLARGAYVIFLSTNLVFDGSAPFYLPDDPCHPDTEYGKQKLLAENALLSLSQGVTVARLTKVIHSGMPLFRQWKADLNDGKMIHPYSDMKFSPVALDFARDALLKIAQVRPGGIIHLSGDVDLTYADAALLLARSMGASDELVIPAESPFGNREGHGTLNMDRTYNSLGVKAPSAIESLEIVFKTLP